MSFEEFLRGVGDNKSFDFFSNYKSGDSISEIVHSHLWNQLKIYFVVGGLPEVVQTYADNKDDLFTALNLVRKKQENLIAAYNADIDRLWRYVPAQLDREQNGCATKFKFKGIIPGIKGYSKLSGAIDWLQTERGLSLRFIL